MSRIACLLLAFAAAACSAQSIAPTAPSAPGPSVNSADTAGDIALELRAPGRVRTGEQVPLTLRLRNTSTTPVVIGLTGITPAVDFVVEDASGRRVWNLLHNQVIPMVLKMRTLAPNEVLDLSGVWTQKTNGGAPVAPGTYRVTAVLPTDRGQLSAGPVALVVAAG